jgi:DNA-binding transcriptional MerR regulator
MYTIGQISEMFNIPASTLRYYDKEGLFPDMQRTSGIRKFSDRDIEALRVIECLKLSGLEIKDIKQFMLWTTKGAETYQLRKELFEKRKAAVEKEMEQLGKTLDMLKYKCWYYETALRDGNEDRINEMVPDKLPEEIKKLYDSAHSK